MLALTQRPGSVVAESFRTLRSALALLGPKEGHQVFLFTSAVPGEGKSFVAVNAAIAFAQQGYKTLLVEADLRRPSLAGELPGVQGRLPGIGDYMVGTPGPTSRLPRSRIWRSWRRVRGSKGPRNFCRARSFTSWSPGCAVTTTGS